MTRSAKPAHRLAALAIAALLSPAAAHAGWQQLTGDEIAAALAGVTLRYDSGQQTFYASGRTLYDSGRPSWGYWQVRGDQYCSQWPPADGWACYDMYRDSDSGALRFTGESGDTTKGVPKN